MLTSTKSLPLIVCSLGALNTIDLARKCLSSTYISIQLNLLLIVFPVFVIYDFTCVAKFKISISKCLFTTVSNLIFTGDYEPPLQNHSELSFQSSPPWK